MLDIIKTIVYTYHIRRMESVC